MSRVLVHMFLTRKTNLRGRLGSVFIKFDGFAVKKFLFRHMRFFDRKTIRTSVWRLILRQTRGTKKKSHRKPDFYRNKKSNVRYPWGFFLGRRRKFNPNGRSPAYFHFKHTRPNRSFSTTTARYKEPVPFYPLKNKGVVGYGIAKTWGNFNRRIYRKPARRRVTAKDRQQLFIGFTRLKFGPWFVFFREQV